MPLNTRTLMKKHVPRFQATLQFESISAEDEEFKNEKTIWIGKPIPKFVLLSCNLLENPMFFCKGHPLDSVSPFVDALENLATQMKEQMKMKFCHVYATKGSNFAVCPNFFSNNAAIESISEETGTGMVLTLPQHIFYKSRKIKQIIAESRSER